MPNPVGVFEINRASSYIAASCRRGMGNIALIHPDTLRDLVANTPDELRWVFPAWSQDAEPVSGWSKAFDSAYDPATRAIVFWTKSIMPRDKMIVLYRGPNPIDGPYFAAGHENKAYFLVNDTGNLFKAHDYARVINF
jgi:hypothetical protein